MILFSGVMDEWMKLGMSEDLSRKPQPVASHILSDFLCKDKCLVNMMDKIQTHEPAFWLWFMKSMLKYT